jgi:hypothetical protein
LTRALKHILPVACACLFAVFPLLSLFAQNQAEVEISLLWWPLAVSIAGAVVLYGIFLLITKRAPKAGALASLVVVAFFYYGQFTDRVHLADGWSIALWLAVFAVAIVAVLRTQRDFGNLLLALGVGAAVLTVPLIVKIATYHADHPSVSATDPRLWPTPLAQPVAPKGTRPPDVYVIIPDDYARADVLAKYFHYDNSAFIRQLQQRGFTISTQARSPYSFSELNMAALLNMDYLTRFPRVLGKSSQDFTSVKRTIEDSRASRLLKAAGYDYVHLDTDEVTFAGGNPQISSFASPDSFSSLWMQKTVLRVLGGPLGFNESANNDRFRDSITSVFSELGAQRQTTKPKFVVFHTLMPHDPFVFDAQGKPVRFPTDADHTGRTGMRYYLQELQFLDRKLLEAIDRIRAHAPTPPVIVIQADEGFEINPDLVGEAATRDIRVKGLSAFSLPGHGPAGVPFPPNSVNALRFVFNRYFGKHYPMLPTASYLESDAPFDFQAVPVE